jgi:hypothetical protein
MVMFMHCYLAKVISVHLAFLLAHIVEPNAAEQGVTASKARCISLSLFPLYYLIAVPSNYLGTLIICLFKFLSDLGLAFRETITSPGTWLNPNAFKPAYLWAYFYSSVKCLSTVCSFYSNLSKQEATRTSAACRRFFFCCASITCVFIPWN